MIPKASLTKSRAKQKLMSEIKIHRSLHQINVVSFEHFFEDPDNVYILLEMCHNQTLNELIKRRKRLTELEVQCYIIQIIAALKYLHSHRVIHRDLKLGNLFLTDKMELKIGDFGLATKLEFEGDRKRTICGTPNYIAPEVLDGKQGHSYEVDIWAIGVIIYTLIIGKPPFETSDVKTTYRKIKMNAYSFPESVPISDPARNLVNKIFNLDPSKRPKLDEILAHDFFKMGTSIPSLLPPSTLACPPSATYMKQYMPNNIASANKISKFEGTVPVMTVETESKGKDNRNLIETERIAKGELGLNLQTAKGNNWKEEKKQPKEITKAKELPVNYQIYLKKWLDYSTKYGLGYLLSNNFTGVYFNDSTKIIFDCNGTSFDYIGKKGPNKQDIINTYTLTDYPKEIQKKVTLLQHFRNYLESDNKQSGVPSEDPSKINKSDYVYVKKWMRTRHAILFRLSNKIVQVCFQDKTEIILSSETKEVTYVNKKSERLTFPLITALESNNAEMSKRLKYTKDILTHMLSANQQNTNAQKETIQNLNSNPNINQNLNQIPILNQNQACQ